MWYESNSPLVIYLSVEPSNIISQEKYWIDYFSKSNRILFFIDSNIDEINKRLCRQLFLEHQAHLLITGVPSESCNIMHGLVFTLQKNKTKIFSLIPEQQMGKWNKILNIKYVGL